MSEGLRLASILLQPVMPQTAENILNSLGQKSVELFRKSQESSYLLECLNTATSLFKLNELSILALLEAAAKDVKETQKNMINLRGGATVVVFCRICRQ